MLICQALSCSDFRVDAVEPRKCTVSAGSYGAEASTAPAALMDCWTFMCTVCNVCRSDGGDQLVKVNRVKQSNKSVRLTEVVRALPVPTILHAPHVTAPLRDVWSARPGDGKDRMLHDEAFRSFSSMYVLGLCNRRRCLGVCWGRESSRELKVLAASGHPLYTIPYHIQQSDHLSNIQTTYRPLILPMRLQYLGEYRDISPMESPGI